MLLRELLGSLPEKRVGGGLDIQVREIVYDSRKVCPGSLFLCIRGGSFDGHTFIGRAIESGAVAVVIDDVSAAASIPSGIGYVVVPDVRRAMPAIANRFFGHPSRRLKLVGVTGTNGKTTTTYLLESVLHASGISTGVIGTLGARLNDNLVPCDRTTPESVDLQRILAQMVDGGAGAAVMEVSSHALVKGRTEGCEFDVGIFTNLTHDHLDFHGTLDRYLDAKLMLFRDYPRHSQKRFSAVANADDARCEAVRSACAGDVLLYGIRNEADVRATGIVAAADGISFDVRIPGGEFRVTLSIGGMFQVYNSLAAIGAALRLGVDPETIRIGLESVSSVDGRFESVNCGQGFSVIVDYAHTPDGLENVLRSARALTSGRLITVFGCGGDRDRTKRPVMGRMASEASEICIVTSDNPRTEDPDAIIGEIMAGVDQTNASKVTAITDRKEAIAYALGLAHAGDLVLIPGKGHETYQILGDKTIHFDDREVVREVLGGSCTL